MTTRSPRSSATRSRISRKHALNIIACGEGLSAPPTWLPPGQRARKINAQLAQFDLKIDKVVKLIFEKGFDSQTSTPPTRTAGSWRSRPVTRRAASASRCWAAAAGRRSEGGVPAPALKERIAKLPAD